MCEAAKGLKSFKHVVAEERERIFLVARQNATGNNASYLEREILTALWQSLVSCEERSSFTVPVWAIDTARFFKLEHRRHDAVVAILPTEAFKTLP